MHEYASKLTSTPEAEFCSCKSRKFVGQNKVKICNLYNQNFKFLVQKIGCPADQTPGQWLLAIIHVFLAGADMVRI